VNLKVYRLRNGAEEPCGCNDCNRPYQAAVSGIAKKNLVGVDSGPFDAQATSQIPADREGDDLNYCEPDYCAGADGLERRRRPGSRPNP